METAMIAFEEQTIREVMVYLGAIADGAGKDSNAQVLISRLAKGRPVSAIVPPAPKPQNPTPSKDKPKPKAKG